MQVDRRMTDVSVAPIDDARALPGRIHHHVSQMQIAMDKHAVGQHTDAFSVVNDAQQPRRRHVGKALRQLLDAFLRHGGAIGDVRPARG